MDLFLLPETWIAIVTLTFLEIVLGVDNIIFISIISNKLPKEEQQKARTVGLTLAIVIRVLMLLGISWLVHFTEPLFTVLEYGFSGRDLILFFGGLFLLAKSTSEIHHKVTHDKEEQSKNGALSVGNAIFQIVLLDIVFSFDSILTAVGLTDHVILMIIAVIVSMIIMIIFAGSISDFIAKYPTLQMLALSFLILIGFMLVLEGFHTHVPKGYIYFAVFFSLMVEYLNIKIRSKKVQKVVE
ncbi:MAG TPA: TerC family protein [Candidatus Kapabacteria bacterium]|nr:TerC family protein [Candidatus Kapabacteria bacterium]